MATEFPDAMTDVETGPFGFVEKILKLGTDLRVIYSFSDKEIAEFIQFMIHGIHLNEKGILQFNLNKDLEIYIKNFQLLDTSSKFFNQVTEDLYDLLSESKEAAIENAYSFSDLINKFVKWQVKS